MRFAYYMEFTIIQFSYSSLCIELIIHTRTCNNLRADTT